MAYKFGYLLAFLFEIVILGTALYHLNKLAVYIGFSDHAMRLGDAFAISILISVTVELWSRLLGRKKDGIY